MRLFQDPNAEEEELNNGKGFYISFDNEAPKRPKPPLRTKRSPKKETADGNSGHSSASTLDSGRSMDMNDRFATTTRKSSMNESSPHHYSQDNFYDGVQAAVEPIPAKRHHISDLSSGMTTTMMMMNRNENNYGYDGLYQPQNQAQQQQSQQRKHLEDVTNYEPQQMHNISYGSSPSDYGQGMVMGNEMNGGAGALRDRLHSGGGNSEGIAKPIIIGNSNLDPVSLFFCLCYNQSTHDHNFLIGF